MRHHKSVNNEKKGGKRMKKTYKSVKLKIYNKYEVKLLSHNFVRCIESFTVT